MVDAQAAGNPSPLGLTAAQQRATDPARAADHRSPVVNPADIDVTEIGIRVEEAHVVDRGRHCPAAVPCLGRPAVGISVPIRIVAGPRTGAQVGEACGTYCPQCRTMVTDRRPDQNGGV